MRSRGPLSHSGQGEVQLHHLSGWFSVEDFLIMVCLPLTVVGKPGPPGHPFHACLYCGLSHLTLLSMGGRLNLTAGWVQIHFPQYLSARLTSGVTWVDALLGSNPTFHKLSVVYGTALSVVVMFPSLGVEGEM